MTLRNKVLGLLLTVLTLWPAGLLAQQAASPGSTQQLATAVTQLSQQVTQLSNQLQQVQDDLAQLKGQPVQGKARAADAVPAAANPGEAGSGGVTQAEFQKLQSQVKANTDLIASVDEKLASMREDNKELLAQVFQQNNEQRQMLAAISTRGASGNPIPNLRAIMNDSQGRETLQNAVNEVLPRQGTVVIENRMPQGYSIELNRHPYYIAPGEAKTFNNVPVGTVTTELVGYEGPKHWALTPPTYDLKIVIGPQDRQIVRRVASPVDRVVASPVDTVVELATPVIYTPTPVYYYLP